MSQSQQQTPATDIQVEKIRISMNLPYVEGTSEKLWRILRSHKIRSNFYIESTLCKLLCEPKDRVATENKNIAYGIDCSNCEAVYFSESKWSGIGIVKIMKSQNTVGKQITTLASIGRILNLR